MAEVTFGGGSTVIPRRSWTEEGFFAACDLTSYSYFTLAVFLFTLGTIVTVFALDVGTATLFASLGHMWLVGPIFICSGLMVAVRTVLYLRKKNMMNFVVRQHAMFRVSKRTLASQYFVFLPFAASFCCSTTPAPRPLAAGCSERYRIISILK